MKYAVTIASLILAISMSSFFAVQQHQAKKEKNKTVEEKNEIDKRFKEVSQLSSKALEEKDQEIRQIEQRLEEEKQAFSQKQEKNHEEKKRLQKMIQLTLKRMKEERDALQKKHLDFLKNKKKHTSQQIAKHKAYIKSILSQNKKLALMVSQKKDIEVEVNGEKFKLPTQVKEYLKAKKKATQQELDVAKEKYKEAIEKYKKNPTEKNLKEVKALKKDVQSKEHEMEEIMALVTAVFFLAGPVAATVVLFVMALSGFSKAKDGSGAYHGGPNANKLEKQAQANKKKKKAPSKNSQPLPFGKRPASGGKHHNGKATSYKTLFVQNGRLFADQTDMGPASPRLRTAVGNGKVIVKTISDKFLIAVGKNCQEVYRNNSTSTWTVQEEQRCTHRQKRR